MSGLLLMCLAANFMAGTTPLPIEPWEILRDRGRNAPMWRLVCEVKVLLQDKWVTNIDKMQRIEIHIGPQKLTQANYSGLFRLPCLVRGCTAEKFPSYWRLGTT
ncbi:hypothetical protein CEXT_158861 [Caerostris extrusa]|uniref:Uncharacterized protein n=1 Tax=Caerostris extrusa TaxID=172846 RepID=A0AAV4SU72_CAEEX|nr:hypothetical protein CEXT_158861 [Caerostris extrusa]